jgi:arylsulfatase A
MKPFHSNQPTSGSGILHFHGLAAWGFCALVYLFCFSASLCAQDKAPNIIYILLDDAGYGDLSCYGQKKFSTPNIDRLASEGMQFSQHYSGSTVCAPTRCSLMSGLHTGHTFIRGNREVKPEGQWPIPADLVTIPKVLQKAGYTTGMFGKWGLGAPGSEGDPMSQGWDRFYGYNCQREAHTYYPDHLWSDGEKVPMDGETYSHDLILSETKKFIRDHKNGPFFAYLPITIPHAAMHAPEEEMKPFREKFPEFEDVIGSYSGPKVRNPVAAFAAMMTRMDRGVGEVVSLVQELGISENTIIMLTSDNGPHQEGGHRPEFFNSSGPFRGKKRDLYEGGIRAPMIAWWPGKIKAGSKSDHISAHWDVFPTLCELANTCTPQGLDGISFAPTLFGQCEEQKEHDYLYWEFHEQGKKQAIRKGPWKAVRRNLASDPNAPIELYYLPADIHEDLNLANEKPEIIKELKPLFTSSRTESEVFKFFK